MNRTCKGQCTNHNLNSPLTLYLWRNEHPDQADWEEIIQYNSSELIINIAFWTHTVTYSQGYVFLCIYETVVIWLYFLLWLVCGSLHLYVMVLFTSHVDIHNAVIIVGHIVQCNRGGVIILCNVNNPTVGSMLLRCCYLNVIPLWHDNAGTCRCAHQGTIIL